MKRRRWLRVLWGTLAGGTLLSLVGIGVGAWVLSWPTFGGELIGDRLARARSNPQYRDDAFVNPPPPSPARSAGDIWTMLSGQFTGDEVRVPPAAVPVVTVDPKALQAAPPAPALRAFWIGHASVYVELDGVRLLVDPVFSEYASPLEMGPRRFHPPPIALADLPPIDAVLITNDHYDHLDIATVRNLAARGTHFHVPLGIGAHLQLWGARGGARAQGRPADAAHRRTDRCGAAVFVDGLVGAGEVRRDARPEMSSARAVRRSGRR